MCFIFYKRPGKSSNERNSSFFTKRIRLLRSAFLCCSFQKLGYDHIKCIFNKFKIFWLKVMGRGFIKLSKKSIQLIYLLSNIQIKYSWGKWKTVERTNLSLKYLRQYPKNTRMSEICRTTSYHSDPHQVSSQYLHLLHHYLLNW